MRSAQFLAGAIVMFIFIFCLLIPEASLALMSDLPGDEEGTAPRIERKRRPRVSIGPVKSKRPGGLGETIFKGHIDALEAYFTPLAANIVSVDGTVLSSDLSVEAGAIDGMRFKVMRATVAFTHPVTGEKVTGTEDEVGMAEVIESGEGRRVRFRLIEGEAAKGDVLRISSAPVSVLFSQGADVDWDVSEEYYYWLEGSDRFRVLDASADIRDKEELIKAASEQGASVVLQISSEATPEGQGVVLRQRALWVPDGREFYSSLILIDKKSVEALKVAGEMFLPRKGKPALEMDAPFRAELIGSADLNCDGKDEIVLSSGTSLSVFAVDVELRPPFGLEDPLEITGDANRKHVWLEAADIDHDGCDEIVLSTVKDDQKARSYVYDYYEGGVKTVWARDVFARVIDGSLYVQDYDRSGGYKGPVRRLGPASEGWPEVTGGDILDLPESVNIHDFAFINSASGQSNILAYAPEGNLVIYNGLTREVLWRSEDSYGGALRKFRRTTPASLPGDDEEMWHVSDRMISLGQQVLAIYRKPVALSAPGLGFTATGVIRITDPGAEAIEEVMIRNIPRAAAGMSVSGDKIYVLRHSYSVNLLNIFRGKRIFVSRILVYSMEGI